MSNIYRSIYTGPQIDAAVGILTTAGGGGPGLLVINGPGFGSTAKIDGDEGIVVLNGNGVSGQIQVSLSTKSKQGIIAGLTALQPDDIVSTNDSGLSVVPFTPEPEEPPEGEEAVEEEEPRELVKIELSTKTKSSLLLADTAVQPDGLSSVAKSGHYDDLDGKPTLAAVATTGAYSSLSGIPSLAAVATSGEYGDLLFRPSLAKVATSGDYNDLSGTPTIPTIPSLATVATSGNYEDLSNKPILAKVATSGDYEDLSNRPYASILPTVTQPSPVAGSLVLYFDGTDLKVVRPDGSVGTVGIT